MSYQTLSVPVSMAKGLKKTPNFNSVRQKVASGRGNTAVALKPYPTWDFEFDADHITGNEASSSSVIAQFLGTYMLCQGSTGLFLFTDGQDSAVSYTNGVMLNVTPGAASPMGTVGDGSSTQFQLARSLGGAQDILQNVTVTGIKVNGSVVANYTVSSKGVVTFTPTGSPAVAAPANSATLTWSGTFQYLCRFEADTLDTTRSYTTNSGTDQWMVGGIKFASEFI